MNSQDSKRWSLSIFLIKRDFDSFDKIINSKKKIKQTVAIPSKNSVMELFISDSEAKPPEWIEFFEPHIDSTKIEDSHTPSAVLLVKTVKATYAIIFGFGKYLLNVEVIEERFGLRVALNSIGTENFKNIDVKKFNRISSLTRTQGSREAGVWDFGLDIERDLLKGITGVPDDSKLGTRITGSDSISVNINTDLEDLPEKLDDIYDKSINNSYKSKFPWVDRIVEIRDATKLNVLDQEIVRKFNNDDLDDIEMAVPEIIEFSEIAGFCYESGKKALRSFDLSIKSFHDDMSRRKNFVWTIDWLKQHKVLAVNDTGDIIRMFSAYSCFQGEFSISGETYVLSGGKWYQINLDFVSEVNQYFNDFPLYSHSLPDYEDKSEGDYNSRVANLDDNLIFFDKELFKLQKAKSGFEFCDLFRKTNDLIHVKRYGQSSKLSHLFAQELVSAEVFLMEKECREKMNEHLPDELKLIDTNVRPNANDYRVVFAIVHSKQGKLDIPFFSKVNLRQVSKRLLTQGFNVALAKIEVRDGLVRKSTTV